MKDDDCTSGDLALEEVWIGYTSDIAGNIDSPFFQVRKVERSIAGAYDIAAAALTPEELGAFVKSYTGKGARVAYKVADKEDIAWLIEHYADAPQELARMGSRAALLGRPDAARVIVDDMYELIGSRS